MASTKTWTRIRSGIRRRWVHHWTNRELIALAQEVRHNAPPKQDVRPVVMFNASTRLEGVSLNAGFSYLTGLALELQGVPVVHFVCQRGMTRCPLGTHRDDPHALPPCSACVKQSRAVYAGARTHELTYLPDPVVEQALAGKSLDELQSMEVEGLPLGALVLPGIRWVLRRHHLMDDEGTRFLYRQFILSAWNVAREFGALLDEVQPQAVVVFNGQFFPEATARYIAMRRGLRVISHEVGLRPLTAFFTPGEATAYPIDISPHFTLTPAQETQLDEYMQQRMQGNFTMAGIRFWPEMQKLDDGFLARAAQFKQIVPVFTNVIFDTSQGHANVLFEHMFAWLDQVLEIIRAHPETLFVIRAHPDEGRAGKESRESVAQWVQARGVTGLPNVLFVDSNEFISSYELIQRSKFVMVYNSTIGLEASLMGAAVLCGGRARFTQIPTVFFPADAAGHRAMAERFLDAERIDVPEEFRANARRFLYYQLYRTSLPFDTFLEEDGIWSGYVHIKLFGWKALLPENSATIRVILDGILNQGTFLLE